MNAAAVTLGPPSVEPAPRPRASSSAAPPARPPIAFGPRRTPSPPSRSTPAAEKRSTTLFSSLWAKVGPAAPSSPPPANARPLRDLPSSKAAEAAERVLVESTITPFILDPEAASRAAHLAAEEASRLTPESSNIYNSRPVSLPIAPLVSYPLSKSTSDPTGRPSRAQVKVEPITWLRPPTIHPRDFLVERKQKAGGRSPFDWLEPEDRSPLEPFLFQRRAGRAATRKPRAKAGVAQPTVDPPPPTVQSGSTPVMQPQLTTPRPSAIEYSPPVRCALPDVPPFSYSLALQQPHAAMQEQERLAKVAQQQDEAARVYAAQKAAYDEQKQAYMAQFALLQTKSSDPPAAVRQTSPRSTSFTPTFVSPPHPLASQALFAPPATLLLPLSPLAQTALLDLVAPPSLPRTPVPPYASSSTRIVPLASPSEKVIVSPTPLPTYSPRPAELVLPPPSPESARDTTVATSQAVLPPSQWTVASSHSTAGFGLGVSFGAPAVDEPPEPTPATARPPLPFPERSSSPSYLEEDDEDDVRIEEAFKATTANVRRTWPADPSHEGRMAGCLEQQGFTSVSLGEFGPLKLDSPTVNGDTSSDDPSEPAFALYRTISQNFPLPPADDTPDRVAPPSPSTADVAPSDVLARPRATSNVEPSGLIEGRVPFHIIHETARSRAASPASTKAKEDELRRGRALAMISNAAFAQVETPSVISGPEKEEEEEKAEEREGTFEQEVPGPLTGRGRKPLPIPPGAPSVWGDG